MERNTASFGMNTQGKVWGKKGARDRRKKDLKFKTGRIPTKIPIRTQLAKGTNNNFGDRGISVKTCIVDFFKIDG